MCPNGRAQPRLTCDLAQIVEHVLCARISTIEYVQRLKFRYPQTTSNESRRPVPGRKSGPRAPSGLRLRKRLQRSKGGSCRRRGPLTSVIVR